MDIEPHNFFQLLSEHSKDIFRGPRECERLLSLLNYNLTEEQLSSSIIDLNILYMFDKTNGIFKFIFDVMSNKIFDYAVVKSMEIMYTLVNAFPEKVEPYILDINEKCLKIVQSSASAKVKTKSLDVLFVSFQKVDKCIENQENYLVILEGIKTSLKFDPGDSIKQKEFLVLGLFTKKFSYLIKEPNAIKAYFVSQLDCEMIKNHSQGNIDGIFTGLGYFCESFPFSLENDQDRAITEKVYKYIRELSSPKSKIKTGNRAAISFFGIHADLFINLSIKEFKQWHKKLYVDWFKMGVEEQKCAEKTLMSFLLSVSKKIMDDESINMDCLKHFIGWLKSLIKKPDATFIEKRLSVQGLKYFCSPLYKYYSKEEAREVFLLVMQNFETMYIISADSEREEWNFLPDYVQCLASFMRYQTFTTGELHCLQRAVINMVKTFHKLKVLHHYFVIEALITTLFYLKKTKHFDAFLENIIYQGVVWSCSHHHITDSEIADEAKIIITVKNYFPLWRGLLKLAPNRSFDKFSIYFEDRKYILTKIVNELVKTLMILINKLNVNVKLKDDIIETDIEIAYQMEKSSDYAIFLNVTDFYQEIFNNIEPTMFRHCICRMINHMVTKCLKFPLVSGFYRLLSFALNISNNLNLFDKENITINPDVANCKETLSNFLTVLIYKMKQFKDELLISCLQVLLESHVTLIEPMLSSCVGIFIITFEVGRSYLALANAALNTLEKWQRSIDKDEFENFLVQVVPCLDSYLRSKSLGGLTQSNAVEKKRKTAKALKKRTVLVELEPELVKFQTRVLYFIGSQSSMVCQAFVSPDNFERRVTSENQHLKLSIPYEDVTLDLYLEPFVLRVVELTLYCSDRKIRVMACELLQAFVMIFLGRTKPMSQSGLADLENLLRSMAMPLLQLSCDVDQVVRQIFEPLFLQLIHWYTSPTQKLSPHSAIIIEALMEGISHPTNSSLRDFAGKSLNEFVKWTIKQSHKEDNDSKNIKVLVKRMRFFSTHPDLIKKLGAALIFNNIYKEIREEKELINIFSVELLHIFITSLDLLVHSNEEVENTVTQITNAIRHLKRIFIEKSQLFRRVDSRRRVPFEISDGDLKGVSKWLLTQTASRSKYCREISMDCFIHIYPVSGFERSLREFIVEHFDNLTFMYEAHLSKYPTLNDIDVKEDCTIILKWLQAFLCILDGYTFIIKNSLCEVNFTDDGIVWQSLLYFLKNMQTASVDRALQLVYKESSAIPYYSTENKDQYLKLKSNCCLAVLRLSQAVLNDEILCRNSNHFWNINLYQFILNAVFNPIAFGFEDRMPNSAFSEILMIFLISLPRKLNGVLVDELTKILREYVVKHFDVDIDLQRNVGRKQRNILKGLLLLQNCQINKTFHAELFSTNLIDKLMNNFYKNIEDDVIFVGNLSDTVTEYCRLILQFSLFNLQEYKSFLVHFYKDICVSSQETADFDEKVPFGIYLLKQFGDTVVPFIVDNFQIFLESSDNVESVVKLSTFVLNYIDKNKCDFKNFQNISEELVKKWFLFELYFEENNVDFGLDFVRQLWNIFDSNLNTEDIEKWVLSLATKDNIVMTQLDNTNLNINIFQVLAEISSDVHTEILCEALEKIKIKLQTAGLPGPGNNFIAEKILTCLPSVRNTKVFSFLLEFYLLNWQSITFDLSILLRHFMLKNTSKNHQDILSEAFSASMMPEKTFEQRRMLSENILPHIFKYSDFDAFRSFFENNINQILECLQNSSDYGERVVNFLLVEILFLRIPIGSEEKTYCSIIEASGIPNLRAVLLKLSLEVFKTVHKDGNNEHMRLYKCSVYKALTSIISNSIKTESFYEKLFVRENNNEDILWNAVIDPNVTYAFSVDFDSYPKKRKILVNIRDELRTQNSQYHSKSLHYIESQRLFNSSLNEDITKFDFTNTILRNAPTSLNNEDGNFEEDIANNRVIQGELYLEATEINNHELMGTVCGLIEHIFSSGACQLPEPEDMVEFPKWMEGIRNLLLNPHTHRNIKIFWVKVIDNMVHIFRHFARYFVAPLLKFLLDKVAGNDINYFVSDVIVILTLWTSQIEPNDEEAVMACDLLKFLTERLTNDRQDAFKYNLDLIKLLVENWKHILKVPCDDLLQKLNFAVSDRKVEVGIHLTSVFLVNGMLPCEITNIKSFLKKLLHVLTSSVTTIYKPCAETIGLMLKYFKTNGMDEIVLSDHVSKAVLSFSDINKYAKCLEGIAIHYPHIVDTFHLIKIFSRLSQSDHNLQAVFLKIICKRVDYLEEIADFKAEDWRKYLESQNAEVQLIALEIILKTFHILKAEKSFKGIVKSVGKNIFNVNIFCRGRMYDIFMNILNNGEIEDLDVTGMCKDITVWGRYRSHLLIKANTIITDNKVLVQGLIDPDIEIRTKVREFWSENPLIPAAISTKFSYLMSNFYLAKAEEHFLGSVSYFLLDSIKSVEYEKDLFEHPLEDCDFEEYKLQTNWRLQHPSVVPMFAETLRTFAEGFDEQNFSNLGQIRATQNDFTFAPTQQTVRERHISHLISLESSLHGVTVDDLRCQNNEFLNPNELMMSEKYKLPKRRFLKDKTKISSNFANIAVGQRLQKIHKRYQAVKEREKRVTIYRSYRKGDFPDIQITLGSVTKPMQMLVLHDSELSKILFTVLYKTLSEKHQNDEEFTNTILSSIKRIFTTSVQFNANLFSTLLDILLKSKETIRIHPGLIASVCQQSGLISIGTLLIEEYIINIDNQPSTSKKGSGSIEDAETNHWLKLAELYKELHEWNLVQTVFLQKTNCKDGVQKAIQFESEKKWRNAQETYQKLLEVDLAPERKDFYYESFFKCFAHLGEWEKFPDAIDSVVIQKNESLWDALWDNDWYQQKILPWYVGAQVKNTLFLGNTIPEFMRDVNKSLNTPDQAEYLKNQFSEELCILWLTQKDTAQAGQYLKISLDNFLSDWQLVNPMFGNLRYNKILSLRNLIEIQRFLKAEAKLGEDAGEESLKILDNYWKSTQKEYLPSILLSESKLLYRRLFIRILMEKLNRLNQSDKVKELKKTKILLDIAFMNVSIEDENYYMTRKYYKEYASMNHDNLTMIYGNLAYLYSNLVKKNPDIRMEKLLEALGKFKSIIEKSKDDTQTLLSTLKIFDMSEKVMEILTDSPELYSKYEESMTEMYGSEMSSHSPLEIAAGKLKALVLMGTKRTESLLPTNELTKALVKLAYFVQEVQDHEQDFILYVLRAMKLSSKEARQLFPCLLLRNSLENDMVDFFIKETDSIPTWMFLDWIPQLLANVDTPKVTALARIILRISRTYPQAIMYSYRLSKENYRINDCDFSDDAKSLTDELDKLLLSDPMVDKFLAGLSKVSIPLVTLGNYINRMYFCQDVESVLKIKEAVLEDLFKDIPDSRNSANMQGNMYKALGEFKNDIQKITQKLSLNKIKENLKAINAKRINNLNQPVKQGNSKYEKELKNYCPWLANFSARRLNFELEIPGQYSGDRMPLVQHHIKISGFSSHVSVMKSLRRPIKITMLGMNSKEYPFLIKFGEDIRQDQRIQQLFILMNSIFAKDKKTYHVLTYQVIPLTSNLGIVQWVENTDSLEDFIKKSIKDSKRTSVLANLRDKYCNFLEKHPSDATRYGLSAIKKDRNKVIPFFQSLVNAIPWDVLRKSVWLTSLTTESFIAFRNNFITSYATICACHWILGIGDRHLQNSKVCVKNGKVLGIDFGHAFGTATQILPIPELVPIRLTPHIIGLMEPLKEKGAFRDVMIECLRSLRENSVPLLATMNVFVQEPSVDWLDNARKFEMSDSESHKWYPIQKIEQAKRKLQGASSSTILIEDLKSSSLNSTQPQFVNAYVSLVEGNSQYDPRASLNQKDYLSVEEQVDSLIDHATDYNLLGRMYVGWSPYI